MSDAYNFTGIVICMYLVDKPNRDLIAVISTESIEDKLATEKRFKSRRFGHKPL